MRTLPINKWPVRERPRERLISEGPRVLSDAELLAVLFGSGGQGRDAIQLGRDLLASSGGLRNLLGMEYAQLSLMKGLGPARAALMLAVREIAGRVLREKITRKSFVREPADVMDYLTFSMRDRSVEVFKVMFLDRAGRILAAEDLFSGTVDQTAVHPREIIKAALEKNASALILVHNHPSGQLSPSREDRELTRRLQGLCEGMGLRILDHLVMGEDGYFSFREEGLMES